MSPRCVGTELLHLTDARTCTIFRCCSPSEAFVSPSDRLARCGVDALGAEELIALILQRGERGQGGLETARRLARDFGSISRLARAPARGTIALSGIAPEQAAALVAVFPLGPPRCSRPSLHLGLRSAADVAAVAMNEIGERDPRASDRACLRCRRITSGRVVRVSEGSVDRAFLPVREILNAVLRHDGRAFASHTTIHRATRRQGSKTFERPAACAPRRVSAFGSSTTSSSPGTMGEPLS